VNDRSLYSPNATFITGGGKKGSSMLTVYNRGIGGQNSREGKARFEQDVLALKPDYVFIYFGLNDVLNEPKFLSEEEFIENLAWMVDQAATAGIEPILQSRRLSEKVQKYSKGTEQS